MVLRVDFLQCFSSYLLSIMAMVYFQFLSGLKVVCFSGVVVVSLW
jgi:hypothetical protein